MGQESITKFFEELEKNPELKAKYIEAMKECPKESDKILTGKIVEFGSRNGFLFTEQEFQEAQVSLQNKRNETGELSDSDMLKVAGGRGIPPGVTLSSRAPWLQSSSCW